MFCKVYSVLVAICITCLFIFSKLDSDTRYFLHFKYEKKSSTNEMTSSSVFTDSQFRDQISNFLQLQSSSEVQRKRAIKGKVNHLTAEIFERKGNAHQSFTLMENNNGHIMAEESGKKKVPNNSPFISDTEAEFVGQFNIKLLNDHLKKCIRDNDHEVDMDEYISIFQQLYKFFCMLGTVFGFIGSDVKSKIEILQTYRCGSNKTNYETVEKMVAFEKSTDIIHSNKDSSGSRTFLRLHRSLIFVSQFLSKMESLGDQDGTSRVCKDAYAQTLAKFHPWLIQKGAGIAMLGLPTKKDLIAKVCANGIVENNEVAPIMHDVIQLTADIFNQCEALYTENDLHGLP